MYSLWFSLIFKSFTNVFMDYNVSRVMWMYKVLRKPQKVRDVNETVN